jgi:hypothetical protein
MARNRHFAVLVILQSQQSIAWFRFKSQAIQFTAVHANARRLNF